MFAVGGTPALLVAFIRVGIHEPEKWQNRHVTKARVAFFKLFGPEYRKRTLLNCLFLLTSMIGLWAGSVYVPASVTQIALREGNSAVDAARFASWATMLLAVGTILGCLATPILAEKLGRRGALASFFVLTWPLPLRPRSDGHSICRIRSAGHVRHVLVFSGRGRGKLLRVYVVAARTIQHRMPRQRVCFRNVVRPLPGCGSDLPGRSRCGALRYHRNSCGVYVHCLHGRPLIIPFGTETKGQVLPE